MSMAAHGARRLMAMADNAFAIVGIELMAAAQGCDFHRPLASSAALEAGPRGPARRGADAGGRPPPPPRLAAAIALRPHRAPWWTRLAGIDLPDALRGA